ncbi:hypothetical protein [Janthinobacterium fluminis]|uniref:Uncharacterized protein n=1 Tax=Janthinobacterium fluminis TaxID=2987524 RepID=A0ABT5K6M7_9BURK|nr:hypothetical protein [Janthinobacterium fluminis]MDC8760666.1 hypothetical protein [Janthinobacterium fluminis]
MTTEPLSVNEAISRLVELDGSDVHIEGILHFEFEDVAIYHFPVFEREVGYSSSIWLEVGSGSLDFDPKVCARLDGKRVSVRGKLLSPDPGFDGCGHMSLWPAAMLARTLDCAGKTDA